MRVDLNKLRNAITWNGAVAISVASFAGLATEAHAHDWKKSQGYYVPGYVAVPPGHARYYAPAPVVYAQPVVVYPAPIVYAPAYPVYVAPYAPVGSLNLGISLPLR